MPCCCESNVKAAFVLGIIFCVLSILGCFNGGVQAIVTGIVMALVNGILVFGAHKRHSTAILVWMILATIECIIYVAYMILTIIHLVTVGGDLGVLIFIIVLYVVIIAFTIWTILVAHRARQEIDGDGGPKA